MTLAFGIFKSRVFAEVLFGISECDAQLELQERHYVKIRKKSNYWIAFLVIMLGKFANSYWVRVWVSEVKKTFIFNKQFLARWERIFLIWSKQNKATKGQIKSEWIYEIINFQKMTRKIWRISEFLQYLHKGRNQILQIFWAIFWQIGDFINPFWLHLTFKYWGFLIFWNFESQ